MSTPLRVLVVEDSEDDTLLLVRQLRRGGYDPTFERVETPAAMEAALKQGKWDMVFADYTMPHFSAPAALELLKGKGLDLPFIIISGTIGEETAVAAMKAGAHDYIMKDNLARLIPATDRELREAQVRQERKRAQDALRESEQRFRSLGENAPDIIYTLGLDGSFTYVNPAWERVLEHKREEVIGRSFVDFEGEEDAQHCRDLFERVREGQETITDAFCSLIHKDGCVRLFSMSGAPNLDSEGKVVGIVGVFKDITDRKRAEEELRKTHDELEHRVEERTAKLARTTEQLKLQLTERKRAEKALRLAHRDLAKKAAALEAANEELSQYAYVVSHDLKAPLRAIHNYADFLHEDLQAALEGEQKVYLDGLKRAVRQSEELVEDLLEFSRVGRLSEPMKTIDIGVFLRELIASLDLSPDVDVVMGNDWPTVEVEPTLLRQIFQDLIINGIKFNDSPRKRVELGWHPVGEERCELFVCDNGIGIEPCYHEQIFGVFQRLHTGEEFEGTGLGLAIVKKATGKLHGSVRVESKPGEGATFFIAFPKTQKEK